MAVNAAIEVIGEHASKKNSPLSFCPTFTMAGAYRTPRDADTAFGGSRSAGYVFNIEAATTSPDHFDAGRVWVREFWDAMRPHAMDSGGHVNFMVEADDDRIRASFGSGKYERLARIKAEYDPENLFHLNANIKPAPRSTWRRHAGNVLSSGIRRAVSAPRRGPIRTPVSHEVFPATHDPDR